MSLLKSGCVEKSRYGIHIWPDYDNISCSTTLHTDDDEDVVVVLMQPITYQPTTPAAPTTPPKPHQAVSHQLTSDNLAMQDNGFDTILDAAQKAAKALDLQRAGNELGFHLRLQHYANDWVDLNGWTTQQAR